jgi:heptosyltransferase-2
MATPVFQCLKENLPDTRLIACVRPYATGILADNPYIDAIVHCDDKSLQGVQSVRRSLREHNVDAGLLLTNTTHSFLTFKLAGISTVIGYKRNWRKPFLSAGPLPPTRNGKITPEPMQDYYLRLCEHLQLRMSEQPRCRLYIAAEVQERGNQRLRSYGITDTDLVVGINPGASFGSSKCWPADSFAALCDKLQRQHDCKILLLVGPGEEEIADRIVSQSQATIINTAADKLDLAELKPVIRRCDLLITNDTGPRHYAVAFEVPNIVLMGPTNPIYTARNLQSTVVLRKELPCSPCHKKTCPYEHHACMTELTPEAVATQANRLLAASHPAKLKSEQ